MKNFPLSLAARLLARDWRSGEVLVLFAALVVAVTAMSAVTFFTDRVRQTMIQQAGESLAADLRVESTRPLSAQYLEEAARRGLETAEVVHFRSVVIVGEESALADIRGVTTGYPLRGKVRTAGSLGGSVHAAVGVPARGEAWGEPSLLARLGIDTGATVEVGTVSVEITRTLEFRPDESWRFMELAPTLLLALDDVLASSLLQPGSIVEHEALFAGDLDAVARFRTWLETRLTAEESLEDVRDRGPEVRASLERAERFLVLSALVSVLLGGVAVAMSARRFVARRLDAVALMKCLGARHRDVLKLSLTQLALLIVFASVVGGAAGFAAQFGLTALLADLLETALPAPRLAGAWLGPVTALAVGIGFALPPLIGLGGVPPARVLRKDLEPPAPGHMLIYGAAALALGAMLHVLFGDLELIAYVLGGAIATLGVLYAAGRGLVSLLQRARGGVGIAWRYGIANIARRGRESSVQVVAFGVGLMVLLLLTVVRVELMSEWQATLPESAPNHFVINIQRHERGEVGQALAAAGLGPVEFTPLARGRISHVNGVPLAEHRAKDARAAEELRDELNLTWADTLGPDNRIVDGRWWRQDDPEPQVSIEVEELAELGLAIGDMLTYSIGGQEVSARITSARRIAWDSFRPNFFMVLRPGGVEDVPHTYITSFHVPPERRDVTLELARRLPSISIIDIGAMLDQVRAAMERAAMAVQYVFVFTLAAGLMVLLAAVQATRDERMFESAVLRALGARRGVVLQGVAAEFVALGLLAGALAATGAGAVGYVVSRELFELEYTPGVALWLAGLLVGAVVVGISGTLAVRSVVDHSPVATLRGA
jgi:putative ABC transport system permease protein